MEFCWIGLLKLSLCGAAIALLAGLAQGPASAEDVVDLSQAVVVTRTGDLPKAERTAARVLLEEVKKRTGLEWTASAAGPDSGAVIEVQLDDGPALAEFRPEGYRLSVEADGASRNIVRIHGADARGVLFGVGRFLRAMDWGRGTVRIAKGLDIATKPAEPIRGHQLGYRATANSYDAWDEKQYEQYIRELVIFGANCVEGIPFQDDSSPVMPLPREEMDAKISRICDEYDVDYWVWTPAEFDLTDTALRAAELDKWEAYYRECPRLDHVFFPGGDPGDNPARLVLPFLEEAAQRLVKYHPKAGMWISLQGFDKDSIDYFYAYLNEHKPTWLMGVVSGPQSPPIIESRKRLPAQYRFRLYPDITHTVLCQYPVPWWDPAHALTTGREPVNPRPRFYTHIHNYFAPYSDGFLTYSDGIHDDINKNLWSMLGWDPEAKPLDVLRTYGRFFFRPDLAADAADGILALETNWEGSLALNGAVEATQALWTKLEERAPELKDNWRWRSLLFRAGYDAFIRRRLLHETGLEEEANRVLAEAPGRGSDAAMDAALEVLQRAESQPCAPDLHARLEADGEVLFKLIGYQTSVEKYHAKNYERGAVLDFLDRPLNNRWWLEDEFARIRTLPTEAGKLARLEIIRTWETPGPGSFYDNVGHVAQSPHVVRGEGLDTDPDMLRAIVPGFGTWMDKGRSRWRLSSLVSIDWPVGVVYQHLDPAARYVVRLTGKGDALLRINGQRVEPSLYSKEVGAFKEFPVPQGLLKDGKLTLTWDVPNEGNLNWRKKSMLAEVWLLKQ